MKLSYKLFDPSSDKELLSNWLSSQEWDFHVNSKTTPEKVMKLIEEGSFTGEENQTFWIRNEQNLSIGLIRLFEMDDLEDGSPLFDLRILNEYRGQKVGETAVNWLTHYLFQNWSSLNRIEGTTRVDNFPMRKVFTKCGYVKEGHYRQSWPNAIGELKDTVRYAILRTDWISKTSTPVNWNDDL
ncbi:GNAT family protein [Bacteriovorax sp. PP10]|uniref:GNAT family protein n=1 Tax=Bacteriovorax antarcticus TaxID=3088717 RepID=A0ABU5VYB6_9BACT|nr:GNAT family protein [Bacteriovorax sp. PP10]MEA9357005.1 GNAT family protein [Bacteriovorax sp. PP10]